MIKIIKCFRNAAQDIIDHDGIEYAGYLAFLALLSFFPFLIFFMAAASILMNFLSDKVLVEQFIYSVLEHNIHINILEILKPKIADIFSRPPRGVLNIAFLGTIWTASSIVEGMRTTLNRAYRVIYPPPYPLRRLLSILQFLIIIIAMITATILITIVPTIIDKINLLHDMRIQISPNIRYIQKFISLSIIFLSITWIYIAIPNTKQPWSTSMASAFLVMLIGYISTFSLKLYFTRFTQLNIVYGSLEGVIALMIFFYVLGICFIYGAELNYHLTTEFIQHQTDTKPHPQARHLRVNRINSRHNTPSHPENDQSNREQNSSHD